MGQDRRGQGFEHGVRVEGGNRSVPQQQVGAGGLPGEDRTRNRVDVAAEVEGQTGGDQGARAPGGADHERSETESGDEAVSDRKVVGTGLPTERELGDQAAVPCDLGRGPAAVAGVVDVDAAAEHGGGAAGAGAGRQRAAVGRLVDATSESGDYDQAGRGQTACEPGRHFEAVRVRLARTDDRDSGQRSQAAADVEDGRRLQSEVGEGRRVVAIEQGDDLDAVLACPCHLGAGVVEAAARRVQDGSNPVRWRFEAAGRVLGETVAAECPGRAEPLAERADEAAVAVDQIQCDECSSDVVSVFGGVPVRDRFFRHRAAFLPDRAALLERRSETETDSMSVIYTRSMTRTAYRRPRVLALIAGVLVLATIPGVAEAQKRKVAPEAKQQWQFGVDMADRGLWSEALFRFEQARRIEPEHPAILSNIAVAHEALGLFEEALGYYRQALRLAPRERDVRRNYSRFVEYYQNFKGDRDDEEEDASAAADEVEQPTSPESGGGGAGGSLAGAR